MPTNASESTRREYAARINRVVDHIQSHLAEPLDLEYLASIACFSPFHFHRLFHAWMGETLQAFVNRLRLERAAKLLVFDRQESITYIALDSGFSGSNTFARAFKAAFGISASEWRKRKMCQASRKMWEEDRVDFTGFSESPDPVIRSKEISMINFPLEVQVRNLQPTTLAYIRHVGPYMGNTALFRRLFSQLFAWAEPRGFMTPDTRCLSLFQDNPNLTPAAKHRMEVAITVPPNTAPDGEIGIKLLDEGLVAIARVSVLIHQYSQPWHALMADWLPQSGYQPDHRPAMEFYLNNPDKDPEGKYLLDICLPVRPL
jgi:AraC family transcriptional regulator